jgi:type IV pilus assembly protein PilO
MEKGAFFEKVEKIKMLYRVLIMAGTLVVLGGIFAWLVYFPMSDDISKTEGEVSRLQQKLNQVVVKARAQKKLQAEYSEADLQFQEALKLLPNTKEIPALLKTITQMGTDSQLDFILFSPQRERVEDFYVEIPVSIEVSGTYNNVAVFFDKVGNMERIVNILNVSMTPVKERSTILDTRCDAVTYRFKGESDESKKGPKKARGRK